MKIRLSIAAAESGATTFEHGGPVIRIGRDPGCELSLQGEASDAVSRQHARIDLAPGGATLADTGSSNGTLLNGRLLEGQAPLRVGDRIQMGFTGATLTVLALDLDAPPGRTSAARPRAVLIGAAAALALGVVVMAAVLFLRRPKADEYAQSSPPSDPAPVYHSPHPAPPPQPVNNSGGQPPPPPSAEKPVNFSPSEEVKEVGTYVALDQWVSVLLRRQGETYPWAVLRPESRVSTAQTLLSLPGYRSLLALDGGAHLTLWGNLPEFSAFPPVMESVVMLNVPAAGTDLDFTLDRGRVVLANRKSPAAPIRVRLRFLREVWDLELPDDKSEAALELWSIPERPRAGSEGAPPPTCLGLFTKGRVRVRTPHQTLDLGDRSRLSWRNQDAATLYRTDLPQLPAWWAESPDRKAAPVQKAMRSLLDWSEILGGSNANPEKKSASPKAAEAVVTTVKTQVEEVADPDNQDVGIFFLAALDEIEPLADLLKDRKNANVRGATVFALQTWLGRGGQHGRELSRMLVRRGEVAEDKAKVIVGLLQFYPPEARDDRRTYEELIGGLDDDKLLVRDLSYWQLVQLGVGGRLPEEAKKIEYDPAWEPAKRRPAVEQWKKLLAEGKVPVR
jgi:hypothetical protein